MNDHESPLGPVDGAKMRALEALARSIGITIGSVVESHMGGKYGFMLTLFSFHGPEFTYVSNAQRADMIKQLEEILASFRKGDMGQTWTDRG